MLAIPQNSKVLVTGANAFVAMWIIRTLLKAGHSVRGTASSLARCEHVAKTFERYNGKLELIIVPGIEAVCFASEFICARIHWLIYVQEGAFDEAVNNVDPVAHLASPYHFHAAAPDGSFSLFSGIHAY